MQSLRAENKKEAEAAAAAAAAAAAVAEETLPPKKRKINKQVLAEAKAPSEEQRPDVIHHGSGSGGGGGDGYDDDDDEGNDSSGDNKKMQIRYDPEVPMNKEQLAAWRREARRVRNRESAAASRQRIRDRITELEIERDEWKMRFAQATDRLAQLERLARGGDTGSSVNGDE